MTEGASTADPGHPGSIGILGGTGPQGRGLARRFAAAGYRVVIGSRSAERAAETAQQYAEIGDVSGAVNADAAAADLVIVAVPYDGHAELLTELAPKLASKIVVDCVNRIGFDKHGPYPVPVPAGSSAQEAAELLPDSTVIAAFHHVSSALLDDSDVDKIELDVLVLGEDRQAIGVVCDLAAAIPGARGIYGGRLRNAAQVEAFTANLIAINRRYKAHAGLRITDV
ncbi:NADPH-dependent F420 reductase [Microlunatus elymi]|uniref:NADPH-dependent F420 reductase n=1 Tax=Microlunatus elymi TaxID=2596828 RepID=A0A516PVF1_9ACTN|nr:NADPH-dependent F420 reductase [Microlunatus elymi]QDP95092.1 NADPH-dependent F420 reductase [Microlunatus elymi]